MVLLGSRCGTRRSARENQKQKKQDDWLQAVTALSFGMTAVDDPSWQHEHTSCATGMVKETTVKSTTTQQAVASNSQELPKEDSHRTRARYLAHRARVSQRASECVPVHVRNLMDITKILVLCFSCPIRSLSFARGGSEQWRNVSRLLVFWFLTLLCHSERHHLKSSRRQKVLLSSSAWQIGPLK